MKKVLLQRLHQNWGADSNVAGLSGLRRAMDYGLFSEGAVDAVISLLQKDLQSK